MNSARAAAARNTKTVAGRTSDGMSLSGTVARQLLLRWLLPVATGATLTLAYPPFKSGQLAWVALVPLLFALENCRPGEAFRRGYIAGLAFFGATVWWI